METCQEQYDYFHTIIQGLLDTFLPMVEVTKCNTDKPWVNNSFKNLITKRQAAWKGNKASYKYYRNLVNTAAKRLRPTWYKNQVSSLKSTKANEWWKKTKLLTGLTQDKSSFEGMADKICEGDLNRLASDAGSFFHSISGNLEPLKPDLVPPCNDEPLPEEFTIKLYDLEKLLLNTKVTKSPGRDQIPNWILHDLAGLISKPLCAIMNSSLREGCLPDIWKMANVSPIPKVPKPEIISKDIRPISLTPTLSKCMEHFIANWLWDSVKDKLKSNQYGGIKKSSTTHALIDMLHYWYSELEKSNTVRIVLLDYTKAFDKVDHNILINKLLTMDTPQVLLRWIANFLSNRNMRVCINSAVSEWFTLNGSIHQGSCLAPLSFVIMMNDLEPSCKSSKFMDDVTLSDSFRDPASSKLQCSLNETIKWSEVNKQDLNPVKTKDIIVKLNADDRPIKDLMIGNMPVQTVESSKLLGLVLNNQLSWSDHVYYLHSKASKRLYFLIMLKRSGLSTDDLITYYTSVIRSVLEYACPAWSTSLTKGEIEKLETLQKRALSIIHPELSYDQSLRKHKLLTLQERRTDLCKRFFINMQNSDDKLHHLLPAERNLRINLRRMISYEIPYIKTERFKKSFIPYCLLNFQ